MCTNFNKFFLKNYIFFLFNNIINSFKSNAILTKFYITFLQTFWQQILIG